MTVRVGVIGVGAMGQDHVRRLRQMIVGAEVVAVADIDDARARGVAESLPHARALPTGQALIDAEEVDAVLVASCGPTHEEYVQAAIAARKPVFCEKPLAPDVEACERIMDAETASGRHLVQVGFMRRYDPAYVALKSALLNERLGEALLVHCAHRNAGVPPHYAGGMPITDTAIHEIDIVRWLLNQEISAAHVLKPRKTSVARDRAFHDPLLVLLETSGGAIVDLETFVTLPYGYDIRCEVVCELGTVALGETGPLVLRRNELRSEPIPSTFQQRFRAAYDAELQAWSDSVPSGRATGASAWDGYAATAVAEACLASLEAGERTPVRLLERPAFYASDGVQAGVG